MNFSAVNETTDDLGYYSGRLSAGFDSARLQNVCWEHEKILFFSASGGSGEDLRFDGSHAITFEIIGWVVPGYMRDKEINKTNETAFLIPPFDPVAWKSILFNLQPIAQSIEYHQADNRKALFYFRELPMKGSADIVRRFSAVPATKLKDIHCFKKFVVPSSRSQVSSAAHADIVEALRANFTALRNIFVKRVSPQNKIVIASSIANIESEIKEWAKGWTVSVLSSHWELTKAADTIATAGILVGNHLSNLIHMVWLAPRKTVVIDASPRHVSCNRWAEELAVRNNITYFEVSQHLKECQCPTFDCYPRGPGDQPEVDIDSLKEKLSLAFQYINERPDDPTPTPTPTMVIGVFNRRLS